MLDLKVELDPRALQRLTDGFALSESAVRGAARRAVAKATKWTQMTASRKISAELRVAQKVMRSRLRTYVKGTGEERKVWLGLNSLAASRLGSPRQTRSGVQVGRHQLPGAFIVRKYGGGVYRRTGAARFPIELVKIPIREEAAQALRAAALDAEARLLVLLRQELNYEFQKLLGRAR